VARAAREEWTKLAQRWKESGLTAREFASETGLKATTLSHWKWRVKRESEPESKDIRRSSRARRTSLTLPRFVEVSTTGLNRSSRCMGRSNSSRVAASFAFQRLRRQHASAVLSILEVELAEPVLKSGTPELICARRSRTKPCFVESTEDRRQQKSARIGRAGRAKARSRK
jgi:hypothetical protein